MHTLQAVYCKNALDYKMALKCRGGSFHPPTDPLYKENMSMKIFKRFIVLWMVMFMAVGMFGCNKSQSGSGSSANTQFSAISYTKAQAVADMESYKNEVSVNGKKNNAPVENGIVLCQYYTLKVNGKEVPVYTTRCTNGTHSFAWIDVKGAPEAFTLDVELITEKKY